MVSILFRFRVFILFSMFLCSFLKLKNLEAGSNSFYDVIFFQIYVGQAVFSYLSGWRIVLSPGGGLGSDANPKLRLAVSVLAFAMYCMSFFFNGYGKGWF